MKNYITNNQFNFGPWGIENGKNGFGGCMQQMVFLPSFESVTNLLKMPHPAVLSLSSLLIF